MTIETQLEWAIAAQEEAEAKVVALAERLGAVSLHATVQGRYHADAWEWWTSGFWPGILMLAYRRSGNERLLDMVREAEIELEKTLLDDRIYGLHHDVGFQFQPTSIARYKTTGERDARRRAFLAANMLMGRFNPVGNVIEAWNEEERRGSSIIDSMLNLPILFWAAEEFNQPRFFNVANTHATKAMKFFVRADGETHHVLRFDQKTGELIEARGGQGYAPNSCWSRGQSWGLYGFTLAYRYTKNPDFLATAEKIADKFLAALPAEMVPPWDFHVPEPASAPRDSSAGAIAASGLLELANLSPNHGTRYFESACQLLQALRKHCGTANHNDQDGLLLHATGHHPNGRNIDVSLTYGDFYYFEALCKLNGLTETCW
jgi:unsaturated chondroitin disaccharide hydrolase